MMTRYEGSYPVQTSTGSARFTCFVIARSPEEAQEKMNKWNIEAKMDWGSNYRGSIPMPGDRGFEHWIIYLLFLAASKKEHNLQWLLRDNGTVHEIMHLHEKVDLVEPENPIPAYLKLCEDLGVYSPL